MELTNEQIENNNTVYELMSIDDIERLENVWDTSKKNLIVTMYAFEQKIKDLEIELADKNKTIERLNNWYAEATSKVNKFEKEFKTLIKENSILNSISMDEIKDFAHIVGIELTRRFNVSFTVEYTVEIECAIDEEPHDYDFATELNYSGYGEIFDEDNEVRDVEIEEDN